MFSKATGFRPIVRRTLNLFHNRPTLIDFHKTEVEDKRTTQILKKYAPISAALANIKRHYNDEWTSSPCNLRVKRIGTEKHMRDARVGQKFQPHGTAKRVKVTCLSCGFTEIFHESTTFASENRKITVIERPKDNEKNNPHCSFGLSETPDNIIDLTNVDL